MTDSRTKIMIKYFFILFSFMLFITVSSNNAIGAIPKEKTIDKLCDDVNYKFIKFGWNKIICNPNRWATFDYTSTGYPLLYQEFGFNDTNSKSPVNLLLCGVHGDEPSGIYTCFHLVRELLFDNPEALKNLKLVVAPIVNPDGFFLNTRQNANGVDPNRNLPTKDWDRLAQKEWTNHKNDSRKYPGAKGGSEPESKLQAYLVNKYKPDKIISIHSPLGFLDFDGPGDQKYSNLIRLEKRAKYLGLNIEANTKDLLKLVDYRFFPGSLGNYAGNERKIPTYTIELPSSDPSMAKAYWSQLRFALLKALRFKVYDNKEKNPFFRDNKVSHQVAYTKPNLLNSIEKNTETEKTSLGMIRMSLEKSKQVLMLAGLSVLFISFQLIVFQKK